MAENQDPQPQAADILVVDDTIASLRLLTEILSAEGYRVRPADGPHLALQSALAHPPGLILLDVRMPDMDGFEVCRRLKQDERTRDVPVIFVSALQNVRDRVQGFEAGGVDFVSKPIEEAEVLARVKTQLHLRTMQLHLEELVAERTAELVQVNEALRESEERYRSVVQDTPVMLCAFKQTGEIHFANQAYCDYFDKKNEELVGSSFLQMIPEGDRDRVLADIAALTPEAPVQSHEHRVLASDGQIRWQRWTNRAIFDEKGRALVYQAFGEDITGRKRAESQREAALAALRESEARFRAIFEGANDGILLIDPETTRILDCNPAAALIDGYPVHELKGMMVQELIPAEERFQVDRTLQELVEEGRATSGVDRHHVRSDGTLVPVEASARKVRIEGTDVIVSILRDITERKRAEESLKQRDAILGAVAFAAERFLSELDWEAEMDAILAHLGQATKTSRVYVFQNHAGSQGEILASQRFEWSAPGTLPQIDNPDLQSVPLRAWGFGRWEEVLGRGDVIHGHVRAFPESEHQVLAVQDILSLVVVPIFAGGRWWGFIGFDECQREREWSHLEQDALRVAANTLGAAIERQQAETKREAARKALRESQRLLSLVIDNVPAQVSYVDKYQRYRFVNRHYEQVFGLPPSEFVGKPMQEILGPEGYAAAEKQIAAALAGEGIAYEDVFHHPDLGPLWMSIEYVPDRDQMGNVQGFVGMIRDITEHKQAEEALRTSKAHLQRAQETANAGSWELDLTSGGLFWSDEIFRIFGLPREAPIDYDTFLDCVLPEDRDYVDGSWKAAVAGEPYDIEHRIRVGDEVRWVREKAEVERNAVGQAAKAFGIVQDITERRRAEEDLRRSKERLEEAQRTAQIGDWEYDILAGKMTWSDEMFRIRGVDPEQYVPTTKSDEEFCHPEDAPALRRAFDRFFAAGEPLDLDYRIVTPQGTVKACRRRGRLIADDQGTPTLAIGTTEDITERWLVEQQITEYQQRLQALASQLTLSEERERRRIARELHDEVGQTLALARTRLASARKTPSEARREAYLDDASRSLRQAIRDTRDLVFDLSSPLMNELGLGAALREWLEDQVGKKHGLQTGFFYDGRRFPLDDDMRAILFRCTRELLTNAVKHAQARRVTLRLENDGPLVRIVVEDDGVGCNVGATPQAMEREGGFGLFSIQERMADLGGSLEMRSEPGQGCTAILTAPATIEAKLDKTTEVSGAARVARLP